MKKYSIYHHHHKPPPSLGYQGIDQTNIVGCCQPPIGVSVRCNIMRDMMINYNDDYFKN